MTNKQAYRYIGRVYSTTKNDSYREALSIALAALRGPTREQVEKAWRADWELAGANKRGQGGVFRCTRCHGCYPVKNNFCPHCGAPTTDEAVNIVINRIAGMLLEEAHNDI